MSGIAIKRGITIVTTSEIQITRHKLCFAPVYAERILVGRPKCMSDTAMTVAACETATATKFAARITKIAPGLHIGRRTAISEEFPNRNASTSSSGNAAIPANTTKLFR